MDNICANCRHRILNEDSDYKCKVRNTLILLPSAEGCKGLFLPREYLVFEEMLDFKINDNISAFCKALRALDNEELMRFLNYYKIY